MSPKQGARSTRGDLFVLMAALAAWAHGCGDQAAAPATSPGTAPAPTPGAPDAAAGAEVAPAAQPASDARDAGTTSPAPDAPAAGGDSARSDASTSARRSAGCGKPATAGEYRDTARAAYILVVPQGYRSDEPQPLLFGYPGMGGDADSARGIFRPVVAAMGGKGLFVFVSSVVGEYDRTVGGREAQAFDAILDKVAADYCVDLGRVFATGMSQGAGVSLSLACARPAAIRGIAPIAGNLFHLGIIANDEAEAAMRCAGPVSVWTTRGAADSQDLGLRTIELFAKVARCGSATEPYSPDPCRRYPGCADGRLIVWCPHPGGHVVPSFAAQGIARFIAELP